MSTSIQQGLRSEVITLLVDNGYVEVPSQVKIGDVELDVPDLWESPRENMDLTLIVDRPETRESTSRLYWLVQRLARALDSASSRRTVTVILIGEPSSNINLSELFELARVLPVNGMLATERMIGPLLRLQLPATATSQLDGIAEVTAAIKEKPDADDLLRLIYAASAGASVVSDRYRVWLDESFARMEGSDA
ncbi:hypothetical protein [Rathayibacter sp. AY1D2]|uniref:hypothetical protein n=1 Tax=Rathayibacter sp. AY1D2 TaxID=2080543 RepID=UPI0011B0E47B|nr:hypothetical protein [Rathayibacter sp. AY1D2]